MQSITPPILTDDLSDSTKFSIKIKLPTAAGSGLIPSVISGEHIGNVKTRAGYANTDNVIIGVQVRDDGRIIITSLYPVE